MSHSRPNPAKGYPKPRVRRTFDTLATRTELDDPNFAGESRHTVMLATLAMDDREFEDAPPREVEPDGVLRRNRTELTIVGVGAVAFSTLAGLILVSGSNSAPAVRPPAVEISVSTHASTPPPPSFTPHPVPGPRAGE